MDVEAIECEDGLTWFRIQSNSKELWCHEYMNS